MKINTLLAAAALLCGTSLTACAGSKADQAKVADTAVDAVEQTTETATSTGDPVANYDLAVVNDPDSLNAGDWTKLPSGLEYQVLEEGNGPKPTASDVVSVVYNGYLTDGTLFDGSAANQPPSPSTASSPAGQRACSSCPWVPPTASASPTISPTASAAWVPSRPRPRSSSTSGS